MTQLNGKKVQLPELTPVKPTGENHFIHSTTLRQPPTWSRAIAGTIVAVTVFGITWACFAKIDKAVPAQGKLQPKQQVIEIQAPAGGVIAKVYVKDGDRVEKDAALILFDTAAAQAQLTAQQKVRDALIQENQFYRGQLGATPITAINPEMASLVTNRATLLAENQLYLGQIKGSMQGLNLNGEQMARWQVGQAELDSRVAAGQMEIEQLRHQLEQNQIQINNARSRFNLEQSVATEIAPLVQQGAIAKLQYRRQLQEADTRQAAVDQLIAEKSRLQSAIAQAQARLMTVIAATKNEWLNKIAANNQRLAEIDSQLSKVIVENDKKVAEITSQLTQAQQLLQYKELRSPVTGTVFDLKVHSAGFVANAAQAVLKIVPDDALIAEVFITNKDIGFVREGMTVDVRVDSFPFNEFGDIKGTLIWLGDDALPPDAANPYARFPAKIQLQQQFLKVRGKDVQLQSGMAVTVNIKTGDRRVITILSESIARKFESLQQTK